MVTKIWLNQHKEPKCVIRLEKGKYKDKVEGKLQLSDTRGLWNGMKVIIGYGPTISKLQEGAFSADEDNHFFVTFDEHD